MTLGNKLSRLRKENNYTQEQLADLLNVSRQSISKWESDISYPETDKLIELSRIFNCSVDYLLKDENNTYIPDKRKTFERKSDKYLMGLPLFHIARNAHGFIAIGIKATGVISIGLISKGIISIGTLSFGVISLGLLSASIISAGMFALGILSAGCFSIGLISFGAISLGIISAGAIARGDFALGALSIGKYIAIGDNARAMIALGESEAQGSVLEITGELNTSQINIIKETLDSIVPWYLNWAKEIFKIFL